jgi:hypothetical protein
MRSSLFWNVKQRRLVILLPTFRDDISVPFSRLKTSFFLDYLTLEDDIRT